MFIQLCHGANAFIYQVHHGELDKKSPQHLFEKPRTTF